MRFYVAGSRDAIDGVRTITHALKARGHTPTFDWTAHLDHRCSEQLCGVHGRTMLAATEIRAAAAADLFVGVARLGRGAHIELGAALGAALTLGRDPLIILVGVRDPTDVSLPVFYEYPEVWRAKDVDDAQRLLWQLISP